MANAFSTLFLGLLLMNKGYLPVFGFSFSSSQGLRWYGASSSSYLTRYPRLITSKRRKRSFFFSQDDDQTEQSPATSATTSGRNSKVYPSVSSVASTRNSSSPAFPSLKKTTVDNRWESFDYEQHWYPTMWEMDLVENKPTKVTLFDVDYVLAKDSNGKVTALQDKCPHKAAALSEGRITKSGFIQCAYHGWSFDGSTGDCVQIPQAGPGVTNFPARTCAQAVPVRIWQNLIWLWPGAKQNKYPDPPSIPEMDLPDWKQTQIVRDFPVDWSLLLSNIMDPDHGMYAHTALAFDFYSASANHPLTIEESFDNKGWTLKAGVDAVEKLLALDKEKRKTLGYKVKPEKNATATGKLTATTFFQAPTTVALSRRDENNNTKFVTAFWVCPVGTGRSRFLSVALSNGLPFSVPRWAFQISVNRFLDQDTQLVASQQPPVLSAEAEGVEHPRQSLYAYSSATDRAVRLIDQFWDSTLSKAPNRKQTLNLLYNSGQLQHTPPREIVLDRKTQHLDICPASQQFVRNIKRLRNACLGITMVWLFRSLFRRQISKLWLPIGSTLVAWVADLLKKQFYYRKTDKSRDKDLAQIPVKAWLDP